MVLSNFRELLIREPVVFLLSPVQLAFSPLKNVAMQYF